MTGTAKIFLQHNCDFYNIEDPWFKNYFTKQKGSSVKIYGKSYSVGLEERSPLIYSNLHVFRTHLWVVVK